MYAQYFQGVILRSNINPWYFIATDRDKAYLLANGGVRYNSEDRELSTITVSTQTVSLRRSPEY